ncbi:mycofactocin precursor MftA [Dietzia cinnamea]|nr:mycofactocin precursor MftA [Dietzia lutea]MCT1712375.1 mycofactocin precursor MftA [Dietzia cinnamea]MCT2264793.1 mycofactocin precursor MftA [Dietzia cinnamea]MCT2275089.1 mycofactocin precursor MftA [Dietzia cinnamea]
MILATGTKCQYDSGLTTPVVGFPQFRREGREMDNAQNTEVVLEEALIEEVSIDGMCGVY